jgi:short-subunit dehydrogenase
MSFVLVTGASSGIGEVFARQLAAEKQNLILVARREEKLQALASELASQHGIQAEVIASDLSTPDGAETLANTIIERGYGLSGLVNNAGFGDRGKFDELALERQQNMIQVNIASLVALTWKLVPLLRKQPSSFIINVASIASFQAGPYMAVYYATKAFVLSFSESIREELHRDHISVSALCPGPTDSEFAQQAHMDGTALFSSGVMMTTEAVVKQALAKRRKAIVIPGLRNLLLIWSSKFAPRWLSRRVAGQLQK